MEKDAMSRGNATVPLDKVGPVKIRIFRFMASRTHRTKPFVEFETTRMQAMVARWVIVCVVRRKVA